MTDDLRLPQFRVVNEDDLRLPQFRGMNAEDYEFDSEGNPVRKDRFKTAMWSIANTLDIGWRREGGWTCEQAVAGVEALAEFFIACRDNKDPSETWTVVNEKLAAIDSRLEEITQ